MAKQDIQSAISSAESVLSRSLVAISLESYLNEKYDGKILELAKATSLSSAQLKRWIQNDAILCGGKVFLKASKFPETKDQAAKRAKKIKSGVPAIPLEKEIRVAHSDNQCDFAEHFETTQQQVSRWYKKECIFLMDQVYRMQKQIIGAPKE